MPVDSLVGHIPDGAFIALPPDYSLPAMEAVRALIRKKSRNLRLLGVPVGVGQPTLKIDGLTVGGTSQ